MSALTISDTGFGSAPLLRNEPVQARSTARLTSLLDAAAAVVSDIGYERLTTAMVAERAKSSIGTVYRYFPERITILHALAARSLDRFLVQGVPRVDSSSNVDWLEAVMAGLKYWVDSFTTEPGFRSLRLGDVLDLRPRASETTNNSIVAASIVSVLEDRHNFSPDDLQFRVEVAIELCDALLARAFAFDVLGDKVLIAEALSTARNYLVGIYGVPVAIS